MSKKKATTAAAAAAKNNNSIISDRKKNDDAPILDSKDSPSPSTTAVTAVTGAGSNDDWKNVWQRQGTFILSGLVFLTVVYYALITIFKDTVSILGLPPPDAKYCPDNDNIIDNIIHSKKPCARPDLFAFQITCAVPIFATGILGLHAWHKHYDTVPQTTNGRLFFPVPWAERLLAINVTFQLWDLLMSFVIPEQCTKVMIAHHFMACLASACGMLGGIPGYYAIYFMGLTEVSSMGLLWTDLAMYFPPVPEEEHRIWLIFSKFVAGTFFVVTFMYYRVLKWWPVTMHFYADCDSVLASGTMQRLRPGRKWTLKVLMALNLPLGFLQLYWSGIILEEVQSVLLGGGKDGYGSGDFVSNKHQEVAL